MDANDASLTIVTGDKEMKFQPDGWRESLSRFPRLRDERSLTGYGRVAVDYADFVITEITCHGRGGREMAGNDCAIIIDVGGRDTR